MVQWSRLHEIGAKMSTTYTTGQIARLAGLHPNTVRKYEEWELIQKPQRKENGYRIFTEIHRKQFELTKKAFHIEVLQSGLRKKMIEVVKLSANYRFDDAIQLAEEYIQTAKREIENAKNAARLCPVLSSGSGGSGATYKRTQAANELGVTIDTLRNWEMNGLIKVKRRENGYRIYTENDMNRLRIIRTLRCANYSLSAILRMLNSYDPRQDTDADIFALLNTPEEGEDIVSVCDKLAVSLEAAIANAQDVIRILKEMKKINPPL